MTALINLQKRLDDLALTLDGDERMLIWKARSLIEQQAETLARIKAMVGS